MYRIIKSKIFFLSVLSVKKTSTIVSAADSEHSIKASCHNNNNDDDSAGTNHSTEVKTFITKQDFILVCFLCIMVIVCRYIFILNTSHASTQHIASGCLQIAYILFVFMIMYNNISAHFISHQTKGIRSYWVEYVAAAHRN
jgi:hypothetical protein